MCRLSTFLHCRISGNVDAFARVLVMVSRQNRGNSPWNECHVFDWYPHACVPLRRISGNVDALARALVMVSRQIRENPPKEKPGSAPPQLAGLLAGGPPAGYGAPPPAYGAPIAAGPGYR